MTEAQAQRELAEKIFSNGIQHPSPLFMPSSPHIAIIILNWNGLDDTLECLESLRKQSHKNVSIYVIDNASKNDELKTIKQNFSSIVPIQSKSNLGFAGGNNLGIKKALEEGAEWIFLLNNDTVVDPNFLTNAIQFINKTPNDPTCPPNPEPAEWGRRNIPKNPNGPNIGILATTMVNYYHRSKLDNTGHDLLTNGDTVPRNRNAHFSLNILNNPKTPNNPILGACAGAALYNSEMLKQIGLLDEDFFLNYEDADLSLRAIVQGWECYHCPDSIIYHKINASIKKVKNTSYSIRSQRNQLWAYLHNTPLLVIFLNLPWIIIRDILTILITLITFRWTITKIIIISRWEVLKTMPKILKKRRKVQKGRKISALSYWKQQKSWFSTYWNYFMMIIVKRKKSIIE